MNASDEPRANRWKISNSKSTGKSPGRSGAIAQIENCLDLKNKYSPRRLSVFRCRRVVRSSKERRVDGRNEKRGQRRAVRKSVGNFGLKINRKTTSVDATRVRKSVDEECGGGEERLPPRVARQSFWCLTTGRRSFAFGPKISDNGRSAGNN